MSPAAAFSRAMCRVRLGSGCWMWPGATCSRGYGHVRTDQGHKLLHRLASDQLAVNHARKSEPETLYRGEDS